MTNRRLVPMPAAKSSSGTPPQPAPVIAPSGLKSWHCHVFLIVTALIWYALKWPLIVIGTIGAVFWGIHWLEHRFPQTMRVVMSVVDGLLRRQRPGSH